MLYKSSKKLLKKSAQSRGLVELVGAIILVLMLTGMILVYYTTVKRAAKPTLNNVVDVVVSNAVKLSDGHSVYISMIVHNFGNAPLVLNNITADCCGESVKTINMTNNSSRLVINPGSIRPVGAVAHFNTQVPDYESITLVLTFCRPGGEVTNCVTAIAPGVVKPPVDAIGS